MGELNRSVLRPHGCRFWVVRPTQVHPLEQSSLLWQMLLCHVRPLHGGIYMCSKSIKALVLSFKSEFIQAEGWTLLLCILPYSYKNKLLLPDRNPQRTLCVFILWQYLHQVQKGGEKWAMWFHLSSGQGTCPFLICSYIYSYFLILFISKNNYSLDRTFLFGVKTVEILCLCGLQ